MSLIYTKQYHLVQFPFFVLFQTYIFQLYPGIEVWNKIWLSTKSNSRSEPFIKKEENGIYYFRYQVNGKRKAVSVGTRNRQQAIKEAEKYVPLIQATSSEVIAAHVQHARNLVTLEKGLLLSQAWEEYEKSPERATPDTIGEELAYKATFEEFVKWVNNPVAVMQDITEEIAMKYADEICKRNIAVSTHNRKLKRIRRVP